MNICRKCIYWQHCMQYRYRNVKTEYMQEFYTVPNRDGQQVIYVSKCTKYVKFKPFKGSITPKSKY